MAETRRDTVVFHSKQPNSALDWKAVRHPIVTSVHWALLKFAGWFPSMRVRRVLLRATGMRVGKNVSIGLNAQFDIFFPEKIALEDHCIIGWEALILCHEFLEKEYRIGSVSIGTGAVVGARSVVLPGVRVGDHAVVGAMSLVNKNVKEGEWVGGVPIRPLRKS